MTAAWIVLRYMHLSFMPAVGFSVAVTSLVGKYIGAGEPDTAVALFRVQIELAKAIQARAPADVAPLELDRVRGTLSELGGRILLALADAVPVPAAELRAARVAPLEALLSAEELTRLLDAVAAVEPRRARQ